MAIALDTLAYAKRLREAGFTERQAEGQAQALAAAMTDSLATKQDLRELEVRINARFDAVDARFAAVDVRFAAVDDRFAQAEKHLDTRLAEMTARLDGQLGELTARFDGQLGELTARFDGRLGDLEHRMTLRLGGMMVAGIGVVSLLVRLI